MCFFFFFFGLGNTCNQAYIYLSSVGVFISIKSIKILLCVSLEVEPAPAPRLHNLILGCSSLVSTSFPSQISNYLSLPFGTQGRSWRLESVPLQRIGGTERLPRPGAPQGLAQFHKELLGQSTEILTLIFTLLLGNCRGSWLNVELGGEQCFFCPSSFTLLYL